MRAEFGSALIPPGQSRINSLEQCSQPGSQAGAQFQSRRQVVLVKNHFPGTDGLLHSQSRLYSENSGCENFDARKTPYERSFVIVHSELFALCFRAGGMYADPFMRMSLTPECKWSGSQGSRCWNSRDTWGHRCSNVTGLLSHQLSGWKKELMVCPAQQLSKDGWGQAAHTNPQCLK